MLFKKTVSFLFFGFLLSTCFAQDQFEIVIFDLENAYEGLELFNKQGITPNSAYNNQPFFKTNNAVLFSSERNGYTEIAQYDLKKKELSYLSSTPNSGEYSPQPVPDTEKIAAVKLDADGTQGLFFYEDDEMPKELIKGLRVGYFTFADKNILLATVLNGSQMDLVKIDIHNKKADTIFNNAGRFLQKIPNSSNLSFALINDLGKSDVYIWDAKQNEPYFVTELPYGVQDAVWINDTQLLIGMDSKLYLYDTFGEDQWMHVATLNDYGITKITRMAISPDGKKIAIVNKKL